MNNRMVIPQGSYVMGTVTNSVRPGKVKGKGEFYLRFDSLTLPNGVTRDFHAALSNIDGGAPGTVDRAESGVKSDGGVGEDMKTIGKTAGVGAGIGGLASIGRAPLAGVRNRRRSRCGSRTRRGFVHARPGRSAHKGHERRNDS